jgi:hypothetical protein
MKKVIFALMSIAVIVSLMLSSCKKDDGDDQDDVFSPKGKVYAAFAYHSNAYYFGNIYNAPYDAYWVFRFTSETEFERTARKNTPTGEIIGDIETGTYTLSYPNMTLTFKDKTTGASVIEATFVSESAFRTGSGSNIKEYNLQ